eukprot:256394_1
MSDNVDPPIPCDTEKTKHSCLYDLSGSNCGWCYGYHNITTDNRCINLVDWCDNYNPSDCLEFIADDTCKDVRLNWFLIAIMTFIFTTIVWIHFSSKNFYFDKIKTVILFYGSTVIVACFVLSLIIWFYVSSKTIGDFTANALTLLVLSPIYVIVLVGILLVMIKLFQLSLKPVCNCCLISLIPIILLILIAGLVLSIIEATTSVEIINALLFLSISLLGVDIIQLSFEAQTKQTRLKVINLIKNDDNAVIMNDAVHNDMDGVSTIVEEEQKYSKSDSNSLNELLIFDNSTSVIPTNVKQHQSSFMIGQLVLFIGWVTTFVLLSIFDEEKEPCFMNLASFGPALINCIIWICHNRKGKCFKYCMPFLLLFCVSLIVLIIMSCDCIGNEQHCAYWHAAFGIVVLIWGLIVMLQSCLKTDSVKE